MLVGMLSFAHLNWAQRVLMDMVIFDLYLTDTRLQYIHQKNYTCINTRQEASKTPQTYCFSPPQTLCHWVCDAAGSSCQKDSGSSSSQKPPLLQRHRRVYSASLCRRFSVYGFRHMWGSSASLPEQCRLRASSVAITCMMSPILSRSMSPNRAGWERMYMARYTMIS